MPFEEDGSRKKTMAYKKSSTYKMKYQGKKSTFPFKSTEETEEVSSFDRFAAMGASSGAVPTSTMFNPAEHFKPSTITRTFPEKSKNPRKPNLKKGITGPTIGGIGQTKFKDLSNLKIK